MICMRNDHLLDPAREWFLAQELKALRVVPEQLCLYHRIVWKPGMVIGGSSPAALKFGRQASDKKCYSERM